MMSRKPCTELPDVDGVRVLDVLQVKAEDLGSYQVLEKRKGKKKKQYLNCVSSFDIEATNIRINAETGKPLRQAAMYIWQMAIENVVVIGRDWDEFKTFLQLIKTWLPKGSTLICFVHNLSYEFQFLRGIYPFQISEVFATENRRILRCDMLNCIEFRCSYFLSNTSLDYWAGPKAMNVRHQKLSGKKFDYSILRWPWTPLSRQEYLYCIYDVLAVVECVHKIMEMEHDDLSSIPLTNTGYIRRIVKQEMKELGWNYVKDRWPSFDLFCLMREAFRGGNTHANRYYTGLTVSNVWSADRSSSYPDVQCNCKFPISKFHKCLPTADVPGLIRKGYAVLAKVTFHDIALKNPYWGFPYIPKDKCQATEFTADNGRILHASELTITVTDVDLRIIMDEYTFADISFGESWFATYGPLPDAFTRTLKRLYTLKTKMKGTEAEKLPTYHLIKGQLNSSYG